MIKIFLSLIFLLWSLPVFAGGPVYTYTAAMVATPNVQCAQFTASPGTYKAVYTGAATGGQVSKVTAIIATSTDSGASHLITCQLYDGATQAYGGAAMTLAISAGFVAGTPPQNLLTSALWPAPIDAYGNEYILIPNGWTLDIAFTLKGKILTTKDPP